MRIFSITFIYFFITGFCSQMTLDDYKDFENFSMSRGQYKINDDAIEHFFLRNPNIRQRCKKRKDIIFSERKEKKLNLDYDVESFCFKWHVDNSEERDNKANNKIISWYFYQGLDFTKKNSLGDIPLFDIVLYENDDVLHDIFEIGRRVYYDNAEALMYLVNLEKYISCRKSIWKNGLTNKTGHLRLPKHADKYVIKF